MDESQNRNSRKHRTPRNSPDSQESQIDPQLVANVTNVVLQTLQSVDKLPQSENQARQSQENVKTIDLVALFLYIVERLWLVVICAFLGALLMGVSVRNTVTTYTATAKLYIVDTSSGTINFSNLQLGTALTMDYQEVFKTWEVHEMVIEELGLPFSYERMQGMISVTNPEDTRVLYITVTYPDAKMAADIANAYAKAAKTFIINTMRGEEPSDFSIALQPSIGKTVSKSSRIMMGYMLGTVLAIGLLTLLFVFDNRPRSPEAIATYGGIPTLAVFPEYKRKNGHRQLQQNQTLPETGMPSLVIENFAEGDFISNEAMNTLCTNLSYCGPDVRRIMITSRYPQEGKSYISMMLLSTLARLGRRVVLVDTDLRASGIQADYQLRYSTGKHYGLSEYLSHLCRQEDVLYQTNIPGAYMIPAGHEAPNPLQLLDTDMMRDLISDLGNYFDVVLVDTPPVGVLSDAVALAKFCDGTLLVVGYLKGNQREIGDAVQSVRQTGCKILGAVLNGVKFKGLSNKHYYYKSGRYSSRYQKRYRYGRKHRK